MTPIEQARDAVAAVAKATAGEWQVWTDASHFDTASDIRVDGRMVAQTVSHYPALVHDAAAIVAAVNFCRDQLPALIAENERLAEQLRTAQTALVMQHAELQSALERVAKLEGALKEIASPFDDDFPTPEHKAKLGDGAWRSMAFEQADIAARALLTPKQGD